MRGGTAGTRALTGAENHLTSPHDQFSRDPSHLCSTILPMLLSCRSTIGSVHPPFALLFTLVVEQQEVADKEMEKVIISHLSWSMFYSLYSLLLGYGMLKALCLL